MTLFEYCILSLFSVLGSNRSIKRWEKENKVVNYNNNQKIITYRQTEDIFNGHAWMEIWRSRGFSVPIKKTKPMRILVMGDSYVWGDGYANMNDLWWRRLQRELYKRGYYGIEVIASGMCGWSTKQQLTNAKKIFPIYSPDMIIWGYVTNDPDEGIIKLTDFSEYVRSLSQKDLFSKFIIISARLWPSITEKIVLKFSKSLISDYSEWDLKLLNGENYQKYKNTIKELSSFINNSHVPQFVITLPSSPHQDYYEERYPPIVRLFDVNGIKIFNIFPLMKSLFPKKHYNEELFRINPANGHPGSLITQFYAEQVADILEENYRNYLPDKNKKFKNKELLINDWVPYNLNPKIIDNSIQFIYPTDSSLMMRMPFGYPYVQLNFSYPILISSIIISGNVLNSTKLDLVYDQEGSIIVKQLGYKKGSFNNWFCKNSENKNNLVQAIRINAHFKKNSNRELEIFINDKIK